jgi:hypothetical protein
MAAAAKAVPSAMPAHSEKLEVEVVVVVVPVAHVVLSVSVKHILRYILRA